MYISKKQIVTALANLAANSKGQKLNTFIGLVMFFIHGERKRNNYYAVNMKEVSVHLDNVLYLRVEKPTRDSDKTWFGYFHTAESIKTELLAGKTISAEDFAVALYWNRDFNPEENLVDFLRSEIKNDDFFDTIFKVENSIDITQPTIADVEVLYSDLGGTQTNFTYSVDDAKFLLKPAGDLKGAPFAQTLDTQARQSFIVTDFNFIDHYSFNGKVKTNVLGTSSKRCLPKPFLLLAGISGTGKTRFVREQAKAHRTDLSNYCQIPVRPDWHEPSDLLGYVSRIPTPHYVVTDLLLFVVAAWKDAMQLASADAIEIKPVTDMTPFWLCLDEMNLAPVEQYFADYLSVLESREWTTEGYRCLPLLKAESFNKNSALTKQLREDLALTGSAYDGLWAYFSTTGIPLPPNLIVAGTVNMDETTHGFSRKVIDRAFTIDFGAFFPNNFAHYFEPATINKKLSFATISKVTKPDLSTLAVDTDGSLSIAFLEAINGVLKNTPFELAFRALNELLISLVCFQPKDKPGLQAVWDDFLMTKVLPRIDGDGHKLGIAEEESLLTRLAKVAERQMADIWHATRPDLLRENTDKSDIAILCRSKQKLAWMHTRLSENGFTSFWP